MPLSVLFFWGAPVVALVSYVLLLIFFSVSKKDASIWAMIWILCALAVWTAGSLAMKLELFGKLLFWNRLMVMGMFMVTFLVYRFIRIFTGVRRWGMTWFWGLLTLAVQVLNGLGLVVTDGVQSQIEILGAGGRIYSLPHFSYSLGVGAFVSYGFFLLFVVYTMIDSRRSSKKVNIAPGRLSLVTTGMFIMFVSILANLVPAIGAYPVDILGALVNAILLIVALYGNRLLDLKFMITRGVVFTVMASAVTGLFFWALLLLQKPLSGYLGEAASPYVIMLVTMAFSLLLLPIYSLLRTLTARMFYRHEYSQRQALKNFSVEISNNLDLEQISSKLLETVAGAVGVKQVGLLLQQEDNGNYNLFASSSRLSSDALFLPPDNPIIRWLEDRQEVLLLDEMDASPQFKAVWDHEKRALLWMGVRVIVPILCRGRLIGLLLLSEKKGNVAFLMDDLDLLKTLGASSGVAVDNARRYAKAQTEAITDNMTGLYNHRFFHQELSCRIAELPDGPLSLLMLDLDNFKLYNDMFGHVQGDCALRELAQIMRRTVCPVGTPARYGGEEFTVILPHCDVRRAHRYAEEIRAQVESNFSSKDNGMQRFLTVSIGICGYPDGAPNQAELLKRTDFALYRAKNSGKNLVVSYSQDSVSTGLDILKDKVPAELFAGLPHASTLFALAAAIDMKDHFTFNHSQNVAEYATALAVEMGIDMAHAVLVREAALLHDIGKIGVPEALLSKQGKLTPEEYTLMQTHVDRAIDILKHLPSTTHMVPIVIAHHEYWNGKGYPRGLKGEEIPLPARCLAVADAFDAMTSERPYKNSISPEEALNEILEKSGTQFDPRAAYTFVQMVRRGDIKIKPFSSSPIPREEPAKEAALRQ